MCVFFREKGEFGESWVKLFVKLNAFVIFPCKKKQKNNVSKIQLLDLRTMSVFVTSASQ